MSTTSQPRRGGSYLKMLIGLALSVVAIWLLSRIVDWGDVARIIQTVSPLYILLTTILTILFIFIRAVGWRTLLMERASLKDVFLAICAGYLVNNILPFRAGEVARAFLIANRAELSTMRVLSTIVIERMFDLGFAAIWLLATLPLALRMDWAKTVATVTLIIIVAGFLLMFVAAIKRDMVQRWLNALGQRWPWFDKAIKPMLSSILDGLSVITNIKRFLTSLLAVGTSWLVAAVVYGSVLYDFVESAKPWWGAFANATLAMGIALPAAPASLGVFEGAIVGALSILKVDNNTALAYAIFMHVMQIVTTGILGAVALAYFGTSLRTIFNKAVTDTEGAND